MKIKLNTKQITLVSKELKETDRKNFNAGDVPQVFKMLQYWAKSNGSGGEKIKSVTELPDGYLCRVNRKFHDSMKVYLKEVTARRVTDRAKERKIKDTIEKYDRLIKGTEEEKSRRDG